MALTEGQYNAVKQGHRLTLAMKYKAAHLLKLLEEIKWTSNPDEWQGEPWTAQTLKAAYADKYDERRQALTEVIAALDAWYDAI